MTVRGVDKAKVKKARDSLIAKGKHPSIDAVRIELGNTGSKSTILKYLNELASEGGRVLGDSVALGDTLGYIVADLSNQLQAEAEVIVRNASEAHQEEVKRLNDRLAEHQHLLASAIEQRDAVKQALVESDRVKALLATAEKEMALKAERLAQQLKSQGELLAQKDAYINSLEEKDLHAREALEHYRKLVKDQREQDERRHEHQVQQLQEDIRQLNQMISVKQTELTQLNKDNSRLATEISETRKQLRASGEGHQSLAAQLKTCEASLMNMTAKFTDSIRRQREDTEEITNLSQQLASLQQASQSMHVELITTKTELSVKNQLFEALQPRAQ